MLTVAIPEPQSHLGQGTHKDDFAKYSDCGPNNQRDQSNKVADYVYAVGISVGSTEAPSKVFLLFFLFSD